MTSKQISIGIGIPMIITGALLGFILAPMETGLKDTVEFVGSLIGILGVLIFIAGMMTRKTPKIPT